MRYLKLFKDLGEYLRQRRMSVGLSQSEVSEALGYSSPQFVSNFERGLCAPPLTKMRHLMALYKIPRQEMTTLLLKEQKKYIEHHLAMPQAKRKRA